MSKVKIIAVSLIVLMIGAENVFADCMRLPIITCAEIKIKKILIKGNINFCLPEIEVVDISSHKRKKLNINSAYFSPCPLEGVSVFGSLIQRGDRDDTSVGTCGYEFKKSISCAGKNKCKVDSDCKLIYSSCGCMALVKQSSANLLTHSKLCRTNQCENVKAICKSNICVKSDGKPDDIGDPIIGLKIDKETTNK